MSALKKIYVAAALTALTAPAFAALTLTGSGAYNLGSASGPGGTAAGQTSCGFVSGQDALSFDGSGASNIGLHAYACDYGNGNGSGIDFGSRASGENTFYAQGIASVIGSISVAENEGFSFYVSAGEVGAFGSTAFSASEFQKSSLTIKLTITDARGVTTTYFDEAWSAEVGAGGNVVSSHSTGAGSLFVDTVETSGAGYFSYGLAGNSYFIDLAEGTYDISYVMTSTASGNVSTTDVCTAVLYGGGGEGVPTAARLAAVAEGPGAGEPFTSYCGAGARSGDPFNDPIARAQDLPPTELPEPMTAGLTLTALLAAAGVRRRRNGKR